MKDTNKILIGNFEATLEKGVWKYDEIEKSKKSDIITNSKAEYKEKPEHEILDSIEKEHINDFNKLLMLQNKEMLLFISKNI